MGIKRLKYVVSMKSHSRIVFSILILMLWAHKSYANDDYQWWKEIHDWDGTTPWNRYLILSPAFFGPNALPVPPVQNGSIIPETNIKLAYEYHMGEGDITHNALADLFIPLFSERVGLNLWMVPYEYFSMDTVTRDLRRSRNYDGIGTAIGDLYIGTHIQLIHDRSKLPDLLLTINLRTASGGNLPSARFIETPGYYFDVSAGKTFDFKNSFFSSVRPFGAAGFYVWQTNRDKHFQNDAYMYGIGIDLFLENAIKLSGVFAGYTGYIDNGDKPMVLRLKLKSSLDNRLNYIAQFQWGLRDYPFNTLRLGFSVRLF